MADEPQDDAWDDAGQSAEEGKEDGGDDWGAAMAGSDGAGQAASFDELGAGSTDHSGSQNLDFLLDIPLEVSVELGHTHMIINKMLQLTQGSVVELDKTAGESVEVFVNNKLLAKGEVVVVNERFGVRITEIISQADRIRNIS